MIVAVIYEASGIVRDAFQKRGHRAMSVDLRETQRPGEHIIGDAFEFMESQFFRDKVDLVITHYTCTYLTGSGIHWNKRVPGREEKTIAALDDVDRIFGLLRGKRYVFENPVGVIGSRSKGRGGVGATCPQGNPIHPALYVWRGCEQKHRSVDRWPDAADHTAQGIVASGPDGRVAARFRQDRRAME